MDTGRIFDALDKKIEKLLARLQTLATENEKLKADHSAARKAEKEGADAKGTIERLERDHQVVRERLEKLIQSLEAAEER
jgi:FtsZ-binding cell division protein ZapB